MNYPSSTPARLQLRNDVALAPLGQEHAQKMYEWMQDQEVSCNIGLRHAPSLEYTRRWITTAQEDSQVRASAVLLTRQHVGNVVLDRIDSHLRNARLSVYIGEGTAREGGVGLTAMALALGRGFTDLDLYKISLTVHCRNFAAIKSYLRLGFIIEGVLRAEFRLGDELVPVFYMGLLREEFQRLSPESMTTSSR